MRETVPSKERSESYYMPTRIIIGRGTIKTIYWKDVIRLSKKVLLVSGDHFKQGGDYPQLCDDLLRQGYIVSSYSGKIVTSDQDTVNALVGLLHRDTPEIIIAIGGGTIIDTVKSAAILTTNDGQVEDYLSPRPKNITNKGIPVIAVPTTAGTGSEVTPWSVIWDYGNYKKHSLSSQLMFPYCAIIDSALTDQLPPKTTAETGLDALTQSVEAYWSKSHNEISDVYALESIRIIMEYLPISVNQPNKVSRDMMAKAALFAGLAFSNTKTTICHSVSYPLTLHWGVSHGQAVSITLPEFIRYSLPALQVRKNKLLDSFGAIDPENAAKNIKELIRKCKLVIKLSELGISIKDIPTIVAEGYDPTRINNAPKVPSPVELQRILERMI